VKGARVRHVIFDIGGVLIDYDFHRLARKLGDRAGQDPSRILPLFDQSVVREVETGRVAPRDFFRQTMTPVLDGVTYDEWVSAWVDNYSINEPGWALLEEVRRHGFGVSVLSNLSPYNQLAIETKFPHFFRATDRNFYSYDLGLHKPDPRIYAEACRRLEVAPAECAFLDDLEDNVAGAREAGLQAMRFSNGRIPGIRDALGLSVREAPSAP
jgi:putative hydrolase of the HAD superfamily